MDPAVEHDPLALAPPGQGRGCAAHIVCHRGGQRCRPQPFAVAQPQPDLVELGRSGRRSPTYSRTIRWHRSKKAVLISEGRSNRRNRPGDATQVGIWTLAGRGDGSTCSLRKAIPSRIVACPASTAAARGSKKACASACRPGSRNRSAVVGRAAVRECNRVMGVLTT